MPITIGATNIILKKAISVGLIPMEIFSNSLISSRKHLQTFIKYSRESSWLDLWEKKRFMIIKHSFNDIFQFEVGTLISISGYYAILGVFNSLINIQTTRFKVTCHVTCCPQPAMLCKVDISTPQHSAILDFFHLVTSGDLYMISGSKRHQQRESVFP